MPSNAGADREPAWWLNLKADPSGSVRIGRGRARTIRAREATPDEAAVLWPQLVKAHPKYAAYRAGTTRPIPVVILEPASPDP